MSRLESGQRLLMNPGPTNVHPDVHSALSIDDMSHRAEPFREAVTELLSLLVSGLGGGDAYEAVLFVSSGTGANEAMIGSIEGPTLLIRKGRYSERLGEIARRRGLPLEDWTSAPYASLDVAALAEVLDARPDVRNVLMVHLETTTGVLLPLEAIATVCAARGVKLYVDAISSIGGHHFDIAETEVTMATVTPNKCLEGLPGIAFVVMRADALGEKQRGGTSFYFELGEQRRLCRAGRLPYTASIPVVFAARAALRRWHAEGVEARVARYRRNAERLREGLCAIGVDVADSPAELSSNIITTVLPGTLFNYAKLATALERERIELYSPAAIQTIGRAFFATMGDINDDDVDQFLAALRRYLTRSVVAA